MDLEFQRLVDAAAEVAAMGGRESRAKQNQSIFNAGHPHFGG